MIHKLTLEDKLTEAIALIRQQSKTLAELTAKVDALTTQLTPSPSITPSELVLHPYIRPQST